MKSKKLMFLIIFKVLYVAVACCYGNNKAIAPTGLKMKDRSL